MEAHLLRYGLDLLDLWRGGLSLRRLRVLVMQDRDLSARLREDIERQQRIDRENLLRARAERYRKR